ncbi:MAG: L-alanine-DL-glutamate epimerase-like enolase superfamily enzyme [Saprospiraceae bacterium]
MKKSVSSFFVFKQIILTPLKITVSSLRLPLKTSFKQVSSVRNHGESIWVTATRGNKTGFGEGCPRDYVTGENIESCLMWAGSKKAKLEKECVDLLALKEFEASTEVEIDKNPAAWCGIETALLDLFAKEQVINVEKLLGLSPPTACYQYSAILGDSDQSKFRQLIEQYLKWGFWDFKIKLNGDLKLDQQKLEILQDYCDKAKVDNYRIRLDANNLWSGNTSAAIAHLSQLSALLLGIEEPVEPKNPLALQKISNELNTSVILDESLCNLSDLKAYEDLQGKYIANIKVSRVGGVLRGLKMVAALKKQNWRIIIGAHVGETSIMTRAGMCLAQAAGENLIGHEGGFGLILLENEPVTPSLMFGAKGQLDLSKKYVLQTKDGTQEFPIKSWNHGWGLNSKL